MKFFVRFVLLLGVVGVNRIVDAAHTVGVELEGFVAEEDPHSNTTTLLRSVSEPHTFSSRAVGANVDGYSYYGVAQTYNQFCHENYGPNANIELRDVEKALSWANFEMMNKFSGYKGGAHDSQMSKIVDWWFNEHKCWAKPYAAPKLVKPQGCVIQKKAYCKDSLYRTFDGLCNNVKNPTWGAAESCHQRILPAHYIDGKEAMRDYTPNTRSLSNYITTSSETKTHYTSIVLAFGQFLNHDMSNTAGPTPADSILDCCKNKYSSPECYGIMFNDQADEIGNKYGSRCQNFLRSSICPCKSGNREQQNLQTSFIDLSLVYGPTNELAGSLRTFKGGLLATATNMRGEPILPLDEKASPCVPRKNGLKCFKAGDVRCNQHPLLLSMHTLMMRNHNHHAIALGKINSGWNDERVFQEARRISIAEMQHITFSEYLPVMLGKEICDFYHLKPINHGFSTYDSYKNPTTVNEYIVAAGRFGHSQMKDIYRVIFKSPKDNIYNSTQFSLKDNFFEPGFAWEGLIEDVMRGATNEFAAGVDSEFSLTAKSYALRIRNKSPFGLDLIATNVQRGRDHGIPGYVHYLKACHGYNVKSWKDLEKYIDPSVVSRLSTAYGRVENVDLYLGAMAERRYADAAVGPTAGCIIGQQFNHIKFGDRFFYEHGGQSGSFTLAQLDNIRNQASLAKILCRNGWNISQMQARAFYYPSSYNRLQSCAALPDVDYRLWHY